MGVLPGLGGLLGEAYVLPAVVFVDYTTSMTDTIALPAGVVEGDFLIMVDVAGRVGGSVTAVTPAGWVNQVNQNSAVFTAQRIMIHTKVAGPSEAGPYTGMNDTGERKMLLAFRRNKPIITITPSAVTFQESTGDPAAASANYGGVSGTSVTIGVRASYHGDALGGTVSGSGWSAGGNFDTSDDLRVNYSPNNTSGANVNIDQNDGGRLNQNLLINFGLS